MNAAHPVPITARQTLIVETCLARLSAVVKFTTPGMAYVAIPVGI